MGCKFQNRLRWHAQVDTGRKTRYVFDSSFLLDNLIEMFGLQTNRAVASFLRIQPALLSEIRRGNLPVGITLLVGMHEATDLSIATLRVLIADHRARHFRMATTEGARSDGKT